MTCKVDTTSRTPSVSMANNMALAMCSGEETVPDKVTTPLVVLTEMLKAERARSATSLPLIAAVIRASAPASAMACPASRALRRTTWPVRASSSLTGVGDGLPGLARFAADDLAGAGQFVFDVIRTQIEDAQFVLDGVAGGFGGAFDLVTRRLHVESASVGVVKPHGGGADGNSHQQCEEKFHTFSVFR